ncbi:MAG: ketosteroid isomerase family protein [Scytolyngbya sp. HA4215-MV1]|jgi:hypothetical protein|nr:ketosteroid isomerase family protein [Scytolyngbya sp. HA4215-MV1]
MNPFFTQNNLGQVPQPIDSENLENPALPNASQSEGTQLEIEDIIEPTILRYFETLNAGNFAATAQLFAIAGSMKPPFDALIVGSEAIVHYLQAEATGMTLKPQRGTSQLQDNGCIEVNVIGKVQTAFFEVNVTWKFLLNPLKEIDWVKINLIASPQELLRLRRV